MQSKNITMGLISILVLVPLMLVGCATVEPYKIEVSGSEKQEYQQAYNQLRNGNTKRSIEQFNAFLIKHPTGQYSNKAQYWLGVANRVIPLTFNGSAEIKKEMPKKTTSVNLVEFKVQCKELGFKAGTQDFGNCVLELNDAK